MNLLTVRQDDGRDSDLFTNRIDVVVRGLIEAGVLLLVILTPWAFGCLPPLFRSVIYVALGALLGLWAFRMLLLRRLVWTSCTFLCFLLGLFLLGVFQITPLRPSVLAVISPATARLTGQLLPSSPEVLPNGQTGQPAWLASGSTISLYPAGTQEVLLEILAACAIYALVRSNLTSPNCFRRLAIVAFSNGFLLALFGLFQYFCAPRGSVYWWIPTDATVFGPFNRNQFACYLNLCIGLGMGLLLACAQTEGDKNRPATVLELLKHPAGLWIIAALILMIAALVVSLSRGGMLSILGAGAVCAAAAFSTTRRNKPLFPLFAGMLCLALGLVAWFGMDRVQSRLGTLWQKQTFEEGRTEAWSRTLPWFNSFPVWGAGYGTFPYLEQLNREPRAGIDFFWDHAHNDYLEMLLEGGAVGVGLSLAAIATLYWGIYRSFRHHEGEQSSALLLGGLFALTSLLLHSFVDYGLHMPSTVLLAAVVCAQLAGVERVASEDWSLRFSSQSRLNGTAACLAGVVSVLILGDLFYYQGSLAWQTNRYLGASKAYRLRTDSPGEARRLAYLEAATALTPQNAQLQLELGDAYHETYSRRIAVAEQLQQSSRAANLFGAGALAERDITGLGSLILFVSSQQAVIEQGALRTKQNKLQLESDFLEPALIHYLLARDLCPMLDRPHVRLAGYQALLQHAEPVAVHLGRARRVVPYSAQIWYLSGVHELKLESAPAAWQSWRNSLACSNEYLPAIVRQSSMRLTPGELSELVIPDDPDELVAAANLLDAEGRQSRPLLLRASAILERQSLNRRPEMLLLKAQIHDRLQQPELSLQAYEELLSLPTQKREWRMDYARLLFQQNRLADSQRELVRVLADDSRNNDARELLAKVSRRIAEGE